MNKSIINVINFLSKKDYSVNSISLSVQEGTITFTINGNVVEVATFSSNDEATQWLNNGRKSSRRVNKTVWEVIQVNESVKLVLVEDNLEYIQEEVKDSFDMTTLIDIYRNGNYNLFRENALTRQDADSDSVIFTSSEADIVAQPLIKQLVRFVIATHQVKFQDWLNDLIQRKQDEMINQILAMRSSIISE